MTKQNMIKRMDNELMYYIGKTIRCADRYGDTHQYTNEYRDKVQGLLLACLALDLLRENDWIVCMRTINYLGCEMPMERRVDARTW